VAEVLPFRPKKILVSFLIVAGAWRAGAGATAADLPPLRASQPPLFSADVAVTMDTLAHPGVTVTITLPYAELSWAKTPGGYAAGAGFTVELDPGNSDRLYGGAWEKRLLILSYDATHSSRNNLIVSRSFDVPPGRYRVRVRVRDVSSEQESTAEDQLVLQDLARVPVGFADMQLGVVDSTGAFTAVPTRTFGFDSDHIAARVMAFDRRPGSWPRQAALHYRILDDQSEVQFQGDTSVTMTQGTQSLVVRPTRSELFIGEYTLELERIEGKSRWRTSRSFEIEESGPPRGRAWNELLEALAYIAPSEEVDAMRNLPPDQQSEAWDRFWRRRDPTPDTPRNEFMVEFFRRLRYAEQHFQGFGVGWRSDMGRIYIKFGPPDQVEQHSSTASTPAEEIWYFNQPYRRFEFLDREGFGRYVLIGQTGE